MLGTARRPSTGCQQVRNQQPTAPGSGLPEPDHKLPTERL